MKTINVVEVVEGSPSIFAFPKTKRGRKAAETLFLSLAKENDLENDLTVTATTKKKNKNAWNLSDGEGYDLVIVESQ